ncbi:hypothetical protein Bca4012_082055 [Brassica carinata]
MLVIEPVVVLIGRICLSVVLLDGARPFPQWLAFNRKWRRSSSTVALLYGDEAVSRWRRSSSTVALLYGDEAVSRWRRSSSTVALLGSKAAWIDGGRGKKLKKRSTKQRNTGWNITDTSETVRVLFGLQRKKTIEHHGQKREGERQ